MTTAAVFGTGIMGEYSAKELAPKCDKVYLVSSKPREVLEEMFPGDKFVKANTSVEAVENADYVLFCVPTENVQEYMAEALPHCKKGAIISGQTSRKTPEAEAFDSHMAAHPSSGLEMVTIHTMCNPEKSDASKEILGVIRHNCSGAAYEKAREFYGDMSEHVEEFGTIEEHDTCVANTQINTSRTFLSIASGFASAGCFPWCDLGYSSSFDEMKFRLSMRVGSLPGHIYKGIQFGSSQGKEIVAQSAKVERELFKMILGGRVVQYKRRVMSAREKLFGDRRITPILSDEDMTHFGEITSPEPNSHFSIVHYGVALAESGRMPFEDMKATTPMHTSLVCLLDRLFNADCELERAILAPFDASKIREDDLDFHDELMGWSQAILLDDSVSYDSRHSQMRERLEQEGVRKNVEKGAEKSKEVVRVCREAMARVIASGRITD